MKKKFITNLAFLIFLNLLIKPFWIFGIDRTVQNTVGADQYGFYFALLNFSIILNILLDLGITNFNNRNISQNSQLLTKHLSNLITIRLLLGILYFAISMFLSYLWGYNSNQTIFLLFLVFNQFLLSFILYLRSNLAGMQLFVTDSIISVLDRLFMIIICSILLWGNVTDSSFKIEWFIYAQTTAYILTSLIAFVLVLFKSGRININFNLKFGLIILKKSYPFALLVLLMSFYNRFDSVMIERMLVDGNRQAGIYAQAFRILDAATIFALLFANLLLPIFSRMIKLKQHVGQLAKLSLTLILVPAIILVTVCIFYRHKIMDLLYLNHATESANIFALLMVGFLGIATTYIFGTLLTANGNLKQLNIIAAFGVLVNIGVNLLLIPKYEALGAAAVSMTTQLLTALLQVILAKNVFKLKFNYKFLILILIFAVGVISIGVVLNCLFTNWILSLLLLITLSCILAFSIGLIRVKNIYYIIKHDN